MMHSRPDLIAAEDLADEYEAMLETLGGARLKRMDRPSAPGLPLGMLNALSTIGQRITQDLNRLADIQGLNAQPVTLHYRKETTGGNFDPNDESSYQSAAFEDDTVEFDALVRYYGEARGELRELAEMHRGDAAIHLIRRRDGMPIPADMATAYPSARWELPDGLVYVQKQTSARLRDHYAISLQGTEPVKTIFLTRAT